MSIIDRFLEDHRTFRRHIEKALATAIALPTGSPPPPPSEEDRSFSTHLRRHARMESELLFPAMQRMGTDVTRRQMVDHFLAHGQDEHSSVAKRHAEHHAVTSESTLAQWKTTLQHFADGLTRHMEHEEREIFPLARELLTQNVLDDLDKKADQIP